MHLGILRICEGSGVLLYETKSLLSALPTLGTFTACIRRHKTDISSG